MEHVINAPSLKFMTPGATLSNPKLLVLIIIIIYYHLSAAAAAAGAKANIFLNYIFCQYNIEKHNKSCFPKQMPKLLADFLQEQQEPFALEAYLVERGCSRRIDARCSMHNPSCSHFLKGVFSHFMVDRKLEANGGRQRANAAGDGSSTTFFNSCSDKCGDCLLEGEVDAADINLKLRAEEDSKQLSPISVLDEDSSLHYKHYNSSNSISQCKSSLQRRRVAGFEGSRELNPYDQHAINKTALQQRKQLLARELIDKNRGREEKREEMKKELGGEDVWKLVCENVWEWSQDSINETNILHLLHSDFIASMDEWDADFERQRLEVLMEIENHILGIVFNEMVVAC